MNITFKALSRCSLFGLVGFLIGGTHGAVVGVTTYLALCLVLDMMTALLP